MHPVLSVQEAQAQLPILIARAAQSAEPCYIEHNGKTVAVLISLQEWQRREQSQSAAAPAAQEQERRVRAYQKKLQQLGPDYWLPPDQQARLQELVEKEDNGEALTAAERKELRRLLRRHEQLLVKRAAVMHTSRRQRWNTQ
jgi:PHD/YefM family antitoxin component YafN of YafNO toxin-antitoxin module